MAVSSRNWGPTIPRMTRPGSASSASRSSAGSRPAPRPAIRSASSSGRRPQRPTARGSHPTTRSSPMEPKTMKELVEFLAQQLVNNPTAVDVKETQGDTASVLELRVAKEDLGRVIGKQGRTAKSIRTILNAVASRTNRKVVLEIVEEK